jgi:hypothetical protein
VYPTFKIPLGSSEIDKRKNFKMMEFKKNLKITSNKLWAYFTNGTMKLLVPNKDNRRSLYASE